MVGNHDWFLPPAWRRLQSTSAGRSCTPWDWKNETRKSVFPHGPEESTQPGPDHAGPRSPGVPRRCLRSLQLLRIPVRILVGRRDRRRAVESFSPWKCAEQLGVAPCPGPLSTACANWTMSVPLAAVPAWIDALLREHGLTRKQSQHGEGYMERSGGRIPQPGCHTGAGLRFYNPFDTVDRLEYALRFSKGIPMDVAGALGAWWNDRTSGLDESYLRHAAREITAEDPETRFVVYGHTHLHEMVPARYVYKERPALRTDLLQRGYVAAYTPSDPKAAGGTLIRILRRHDLPGLFQGRRTSGQAVCLLVRGAGR